MRVLHSVPDEFLQVRRSPHLWQESPHQLPGQHVGDLAEDVAAQLQGVLHHQHLPLVLGAGESLVRLLNTQTSGPAKLLYLWHKTKRKAQNGHIALR